MRRVRRRSAPKRKRQFAPRRQVQNRQPVHYFKRSYYVTNGLTAFGANSYTPVNIALTSLPNYTEFTALYDQYKITGLKVKFVPRGNSSDITTQNNISSLFTVIDLDDGNPLTTVDQAMQYQSMKMCRSTQTQVRYLKPRFNVGAINQVAGGLIGKKNTNGWLDCTSDSVVHYGIKTALTAGATQSVIYDLMVTVYLAFKNVR